MSYTRVYVCMYEFTENLNVYSLRIAWANTLIWYIRQYNTFIYCHLSKNSYSVVDFVAV